MPNQESKSKPDTVEQPSGEGLQSTNLFGRLLYIYALNGVVKCFSADEIRPIESAMLDMSWQHTATIDPARWIEAMANGNTAPSDMLDEIQFCPTNVKCGGTVATNPLLITNHQPTPKNMQTATKPTIVCLCGSTRFMDAFQSANLTETIAGKIVLSIGCNTKSDSDLIALGELTEEDKAALDELHKRKIDLADEVLVLNVDGYIGESTRSEIEYAVQHAKPVRYLNRSSPPANP